MGILLMIQKNDNKKIKSLKKTLGIHSKVDVVRAGLILLEKEAQRLKRIKRWKRAARLVLENSREINKEFQAFSRIKLL